MRDNAKQADRRGRGNLWGRHSKSIPEGGYYLTLSCIMGSFFPGSESMIPRVYDLLGVRWGTNPDARSGWTCCTGIAYHGDVMPIEGLALIGAAVAGAAGGALLLSLRACDRVSPAVVQPRLDAAPRGDGGGSGGRRDVAPR